MSIIGACMVPHPPIILPEIGRGEERKIADTALSYEKAADLVRELRPDTIVIASPHTRMYSDWFYIGGGERGSGNFGRFRAGGVKIRADYDTEVISALSEKCRRTSFPAGVVEDPDIPLDHGVMIPLYFIQKKYTDFRLVRIGISGLSYSDHYRLGQMIREISDSLSRRVFFVGSGDLSHKLKEDGPYGFIEEGPVYDERIMDVMGRGAFGELFDFDPAFCEKASECGHRAFIMMAGALDRTSLEITRLSHQDTFGVGYGVCTYRALGEDPERAFLDQWEEKERKRLQERKDAEDIYVRLARLSVETYVAGRRPLSLREAEKKLSLPEVLKKTKAGAFVSLHKEGQLRGCIGTIAPTCSCLAEEILQNGISACSRDHRFSPVAPEELPFLEYSVDVLGEAETIISPDQLDVKRYGVIVSRGRKRGLLLPNLEGVDTVEDQIAIAARKAGISDHDFEQGVTLQRFEVVRHT